MTPLVTLIIPNWNGRNLLEACLMSVSSQTLCEFEVIVVDNGSTDGSVDYLQTSFPWVRVLAKPANIGFAGAVNQGIRESLSTYIGLINNDVWLESRWLEEMVRAADSQVATGVVASKILLVTAPDRLDSAGIGVDRAGFAWNLGRGEKDNPADLTPREVFGACAAAALYRREMLEQIGLFDEDFFAYLEDADLSWRAQLAGWRCLYAPAARAYHVHSATAGQGSDLKTYLLARNRVWYVLKNYPTAHLLSAMPLIAAYDLASLLGNIVCGKARPALSARLDAFRGAAEAVRKRRQVQRLRVPASQWTARLCSLRNPLSVWRTEHRLSSAATLTPSNR